MRGAGSASTPAGVLLRHVRHAERSAFM